MTLIRIDNRPHCARCAQRCRVAARGLCSSCHKRPGVKEQYGVREQSNSRGVGNFNGGTRLATPTDAMPNTPEKVAVLEERARLGLALFHPEDAMRNTG